MLDSCFMKKVHIELKASLRCRLTKYLFTLGLVQNGPLILSVGQESWSFYILEENHSSTYSQIRTEVCLLTKIENFNFPGLQIKEVCNRGMACSLLKLGSLEKNIIASLFHSGLLSDTIFCEKNDVICHFRERQYMSIFWEKKTKNILVPNWFFDHLQLFLV